ncbi:hypothetical protein MHYP_G00359830 [Metynnis hypsauchen]
MHTLQLLRAKGHSAPARIQSFRDSSEGEERPALRPASGALNATRFSAVFSQYMKVLATSKKKVSPVTHQHQPSADVQKNLQTSLKCLLANSIQSHVSVCKLLSPAVLQRERAEWELRGSQLKTNSPHTPPPRRLATLPQLGDGFHVRVRGAGAALREIVCIF